MMLNRRKLLWLGPGAVAVAGVGGYSYLTRRPPLGFVPNQEFVARARAILERTAAVDIHAHPGRTFLRGASDLSTAIWLYSLLGSFETDAIADMQAGGLAAASFAAVADVEILDFNGNGLTSRRAFNPGEAWTSFRRQLANLKVLEKAAPLRIAREPGDIAAAKAAKRVAAILTVEGGDFLEGELSRLAQVEAEGIRSITIVHYHNNQIGDIQTAPPQNGGLTKFGEAVVREMTRLGMIVDVAHATEATALRAIEIAERPVLCSHTHLRGGAVDHPRFISSALAQAIVQRGGVIGAWPAGIGIASLSDFVDRILYLIDKLGADHVALGTDMDANYRPVMDSYVQLPLVVSELLRRGLGEVDTVKFLNGNFMRVFEAVRFRRAVA